MYLEEEVLHKEDSVHAPNTFDSMDVFSDKSVDIKEQAPTTVDFCNVRIHLLVKGSNNNCCYTTCMLYSFFVRKLNN